MSIVALVATGGGAAWTAWFTGRQERMRAQDARDDERLLEARMILDEAACTLMDLIQMIDRTRVAYDRADDERWDLQRRLSDSFPELWRDEVRISIRLGPEASVTVLFRQLWQLLGLIVRDLPLMNQVPEHADLQPDSPRNLVQQRRHDVAALQDAFHRASSDLVGPSRGIAHRRSMRWRRLRRLVQRPGRSRVAD